MNLTYVLLEKDNRESFESVYPSVIPDEPDRVSIGAASKKGEVLGAVSFVYVNCQINIDWLYVNPLVRNQGVGRGLVMEIIRMIRKTGERYPLVARFPVTEEDTSLHRFFLTMEEFEVSYSHDRYYVTAEDLRKQKRFRKMLEEDQSPVRFFEEPIETQKLILALLESEQVYSVGDYEKWKENCVPELCFSLVMDDTLAGLIFVQKKGKDLELDWLYSKYPPALYSILKTTLEETKRLYPEADVTFEVMNDEARRLAEKSFPEAKRAYIYEAHW